MSDIAIIYPKGKIRKEIQIYSLQIWVYFQTYWRSILHK